MLVAWCGAAFGAAVPDALTAPAALDAAAPSGVVRAADLSGLTFKDWMGDLMHPPNSTDEMQVLKADNSYLLGLKEGYVDQDGVARTKSGDPAAPYMGCGDEQGEWGGHGADGSKLTWEAEKREEALGLRSQRFSTAPELMVVRSLYSRSFFHIMAETLPRSRLTAAAVVLARPTQQLVILHRQ